jgi:transposase-like protein
MVLIPVKCPVCNGVDVTKHGTTSNGKQRFICKAPDCEGQTFIQDYSENGRLPETKQQIIEMALNGSGVRDTARVLNISPTTVINELKKRAGIARREPRLFGGPQARGDRG